MQKTDAMVPLVQTRAAVLDIAVLRRGTGVGALVGVLAAGLYAWSFFLEAAKGIAGYQAFLLALYLPPYWPMWAANPVFWFGLSRLSQGRYHAAGAAGLVALLLALSESWLCGNLEAGYFVWAGSMAVLALAGLCREPAEPPTGWRHRPAWLPGGEASRIASPFLARRSGK